MPRVSRVLVAAAFLLVVLLAARAAVASCPETTAAAPPECCITDPREVKIPLPEHVRVGIRVLRLSRISERDGTFSADMYVLTRYPAGGLRPDLYIRNAADTPNIVEDRLDLVDGFCYRSRRIQDDMETPFLLKRFPFDTQALKVILEDPSWAPGDYVYDDDLFPDMISKEAYSELAAWRFIGYPSLAQRSAGFGYHPGDEPSRVLTIDIPVQREWQFYLTRYFLPLLLIVALSYSLFFIKSDDLSSSSGIGITAVLAIIAFQLTQSDTMPKVGYLTLADKVYSVCYLFTAAALGLVIHGAWVTTYHDDEERAHRLQRRYRLVFPFVFILCFVLAGVWGWLAGRGETAEPQTLAPPPVPAGEKVY
jgi:hypothetical protein